MNDEENKTETTAKTTDAPTVQILDLLDGAIMEDLIQGMSFPEDEDERPTDAYTDVMYKGKKYRIKVEEVK